MEQPTHKHRQTSTANIVFGAKANVWRWITKLEKAEFNKSLTQLPTVEKKYFEVLQGSIHPPSKNLCQGIEWQPT